MPPDWQPDDEDRRFALERGYDEAWIARNAELCRDHYQQPGAKQYWNWHAAWRGWVNRAPQMGDSGTRTASATGGGSGPAVADTVPPARDLPAHALGSPGDRLRMLIGDTAFARWFDGAQCVVDGAAVEIAVPSRFARDWIAAQYELEIRRAWGTRRAAVTIRREIDPELREVGT
jgi:hypothetical protein